MTRHRFAKLRVDPAVAAEIAAAEIGGAHDPLRAVHDALGHARLNVGFDRDGEYAAWRYPGGDDGSA